MIVSLWKTLFAYCNFIHYLNSIHNGFCQNTRYSWWAKRHCAPWIGDWFCIECYFCSQTQQEVLTIITSLLNQPAFPLGFSPGNSSYKRSSSLRNNIDLASAIVEPDSAPEIIRSECFSRIHSRHKGEEWTLMSIQIREHAKRTENAPFLKFQT